MKKILSCIVACVSLLVSNQAMANHGPLGKAKDATVNVAGKAVGTVKKVASKARAVPTKVVNGTKKVAKFVVGR